MAAERFEPLPRAAYDAGLACVTLRTLAFGRTMRTVGGWNETRHRPFINGLMAHAAIWKRILTDPEIADIAQAVLP